MKKFFLYFVLGIFIPTCVYAQEKLLFSIDIVRHGDRTPLIASPEMEKIWPQGVGQLTPKGMRQEYELGKVLRKRYVKKYHLLPKQYDTRTMSVRSSGMTRTLMSAQSLLLGLYPLGTGPVLNESSKALPKGFQPVPINTVPREQDTLLIPSHDKEQYKQLLETYIFSSPEWIQKDQSLRSNYPAWSKVAGIPINNLLDLIQFGDCLMIEHLYNVPLPQGLEENEADTIIEAGKWAMLTLVNHPKLAAIAGNELAQTIKHEINLATEQNRPLKYLLFVAHDTTIAAQLKLLGQTMDNLPPYASQLNYSLFDEGNSNYEVRVTYNQQPLMIEQCGGDVCSLSEFISVIDNQLNQTENLTP